MWLFDKPGFADAKSIGNLVYPWFVSILGMASACVVYGFALIFLIFQLQFFFLFFLGAFVWGPIMSPKHLSRGGGNALLAPKNTL